MTIVSTCPPLLFLALASVPALAHGIRVDHPSKLDLTPADRGPASASPMNRAHEPWLLEPPPAWARGAVWYQVFPERYRNADPANDPHGLHQTLLAWDAHWFQVSLDEVERLWAYEASTLTRTDPGRAMLRRVIHRRRFGGDLQGVVEMLPALRQLGVDVLYLTPVFDARSLHKYDASDHRHVDPTLAIAGGDVLTREGDDPTTWGWTASDRYLLDVLLPSARAIGMRVVLDAVWNHVGVEHWAFRDVLERGTASPYAGWFRVNFDERGRVRSWAAWDGENGDLPEFAQTLEGDLVPDVKAHVEAVTRRWMDPDGDGDPSDGIDGWRLDVVPEIGLTFWRDWCALARSINPSAVLVAEIWEPAPEHLAPGVFDAQMNYPFAMAIVPWLRGERDSAWLSRQLDMIAAGLAESTRRAQLNLIASHDTERLASMIENPRRAFDYGADPLAPGSRYRARTLSEATRELALLAFAFQATYSGSPMIYAGDEWFLAGADDPHNRAPIPWPDLEHPQHSQGVDPPADLPDPADRLRTGDADFRAGVARWMNLRRDPEVGNLLRQGGIEHIETADPEVFAFRRPLDGRELIVVLNRGDHAVRLRTILPNLPDQRALYAVFPENIGKPVVEVPRRSAMILRAE